MLLFTLAGAVMAEKVDFDKIVHWAGTGENRAALVIQFNDDKDDVAYVWGYRWNGTASGEDMLREVAACSSSLSALVQYTGSMGSTLDGIGISANRKLLDHLEYDFQSAAIDGQVSFGYFEPNSLMGQTSAPGNETPQLVKTAIEASKTKGIIEHPLNARRYGYPAYDYDFWLLSANHKEDPDLHWQAGWYNGYWSYWIGSEGQELSDASYSGLGMSSAQLTPGSVNLWNYASDMVNWENNPGPSSNLDYAMTDYGEKMTPHEPEPYAVDFDKIKYWAGEGEKYAALVIKFNDGKSPDCLVTGYRWSGGWDDTVSTMITNVLNGDKAFHVTLENGVIVSIGYDTDCDGVISGDDHNMASGKWDIYADYRNEPEIYKVTGTSFVNPRAVIILTCTPAGKEPDYTIENPTYIEKADIPDDPDDPDNPDNPDNPDQPGAVEDVDTAAPSVKASADGTVILSGCNGYVFTIYDLSGREVSSFGCHDDVMTYNPRTGKGLFIIQGKSKNKIITLKYIVK